MPYIAVHYLAGILIIHAFCLACYVTGSLVRRPRAAANDASALADIVITIVTGMAIFGFAVFAIGFAGLLNPLGFSLIAIAEVAALVWAFRVSAEQSRTAARCALQTFRCAASPANLIVYVAALVVIIPAALPVGEFDVMSYYAPYPFEWAQAGRIFVDLTLPTPYYVNNFPLFTAAFDALGFGNFTNFLTGLTGSLSILGIFAVIRAYALEQAGDAWFERVLAFGLPAAFAAALVTTPSFLRWANGGMLDVPIGLFLLVPVMCAARALLRPGRHYGRELILVGAFFLGMKPTLPVFLPLFLALWFVSQDRLPGWRRCLTAGVLLIVLGSPWYVRNAIMDADPAPPLLHILMHKTDPVLGADYVRNQSSQLQGSASPGALLGLPLRYFVDAQTSEFVEYGSNFAVVLLYAPFVAIGAAIVGWRKRAVPPLPLLCAAAFAFAYGYWILTSHHSRFFLEIEPVFLIALGTLAVTLVRMRAVAVRGAVLAIALLSVLPSPSAFGFFSSMWQTHYVGIADYMTSPAAFAKQYCDGCPEVAIVAQHVAPGDRVFTFGLSQVTYLLRERGITNLGNVLSAETAKDLVAAAQHDDLAAYLHAQSIGALMVDTRTEWPDNSRREFDRQIAALGFKVLTSPRPMNDGHILMYVH
jgi:hypothetical protein